PAGSVLVKEFSVAGKRVETRLLVSRADSSWEGFSYAWDATDTDATLVPDGRTVALASGDVWKIPSRGQCLECHTRAAGVTLGLTTAQLNRDFAPGTAFRGNQIDRLRKLGLFERDPGPCSKLARAPALD